ncbi:MAG: hypothetical protein Tsb0020_14480 [Haliangiales bacterium]
MAPDTSDYYIAVVLFVSTSDSATYRPLYEESLLLVTAADEDAAHAKAETAAKARETTYDNDMGETIMYAFKEIVDVRQVDDALVDGAEVYSRHFRNYDAYRDFEPMLDGSID